MTVLAIPLVDCQYIGEDEKLPNSPFPSATAQSGSLQGNIDDVARLLEVSTTEPGMPSEANPAGELTVNLAPGDYEITAACAGVPTATLSLVKGGGPPETTEYPCDGISVRYRGREASRKARRRSHHDPRGPVDGQRGCCRRYGGAQP